MTVEIKRYGEDEESLDSGRTRGTVVFSHKELTKLPPLQVQCFKGEETDLLHFLQCLEDYIWNGQGVSVFIPPREGDDYLCGIANAPLGKAELLQRAYFYIFSNAGDEEEGERLLGYTSAPSAIFLCAGETVNEFLIRMSAYLGPTMKITPCAVVEQLWGGRPDEFGDSLIRNGPLRIFPRELMLNDLIDQGDQLPEPRLHPFASNNHLVYSLGMSLERYLELVESSPPVTCQSFEDYFIQLVKEDQYHPFSSRGQMKLWER